MKKVTSLILLASLSVLLWGQVSISDSKGEITPLYHKNGNIGIETTDITERLVLYNPKSLQVSTQYGNLSTGIGLNNGFVVGIEGAGNGIVWNRENQFIRFGTNAIERIRISANGNVGIGTSNPLDKFHIENGDLRITNDLQSGGDGTASIIFSEISNNSDAHARISYHGDDVGGNFNYIGFCLGENVTKGQSQFVIQRSGNVGIGTTTPSAKLDVAGNIKAHEIEVTLASMQDLQLNGTLAANNITYTTNGNTADFVFEDNYYLKDLSEVEAFIKANKHLPEVPSAAEMEEAGVNLAEMNKLLLMKVEELTLYAIEKDKKVEGLELKVEELRKMEERLAKLEALLSK